MSRTFNDGAADGLIPLVSLHPDSIGDSDELLQAMSKTAFGGRNLGEAAEVLTEMIADPECSVILTLSGAMTVAKMGLLVTHMIEKGWVQAVVSTGALMTHGLIELAGMQHYKAEPGADDVSLFEKGYNRVYDTYEMEKNLNDLERHLNKILGRFCQQPAPRDASGGPLAFGSHHLCSELGRQLDKHGVSGIVVAAHRAGVPIFIPAFTDSELGLNVATWLMESQLGESPNRERAKECLAHLKSPFDPFLDLGHYTRLVHASPRLGIFTIGGGVPRNWAQQAPPFIDIYSRALGLPEGPAKRFRYGVRVCPDPAHIGGLSGCSYSEGVSWGKFVPPSEGGRFAEVRTDATIVWPLLVKGVSERLSKREIHEPS